MTWKRNPPAASHMGGVWERQIRTIRGVLTALLQAHTEVLDEESLLTLMTEAECIVNSRPLSIDTISDPTSVLPLPPMQLLTMKTDVVLPPPGNFTRNDVYCRRRWMRVQYMANLFWKRWKKEYLQSLQPRLKWNKLERNFTIGDVVLVKWENDYCMRNSWPMTIVTEVYPDVEGVVRKVKIRTSSKGNLSLLDRPISKLVLLVNAED